MRDLNKYPLNLLINSSSFSSSLSIKLAPDKRKHFSDAQLSGPEVRGFAIHLCLRPHPHKPGLSGGALEYTWKMTAMDSKERHEMCGKKSSGKNYEGAAVTS